MICPQCRTELGLFANRCPSCDITLLPDEFADEANEDTEWVEVGVFQNRFEADLAGTALTSAGIEFFMTGEALGAYGPITAFSGGISLLVRPADADAAREILSPRDSERGFERDD